MKFFAEFIMLNPHADSLVIAKTKCIFSKFIFQEAGYLNIHILNLSYNLIFWIGLHAFSGLNSLTHLDLSNNRLRHIPSDLFWDTPMLDTLDLSANIFESLKNEPLIMHSTLQVRYS